MKNMPWPERRPVMGMDWGAADTMGTIATKSSAIERKLRLNIFEKDDMYW